MAEFCKECFKKNILTSSDNIADSQLMLSAAWDICEGCGEYKQIVVGIEETEMSLYNNDTNHDRIRNMDLDEMATSIYKYVHNTCRFCVYSKGWKCTSALKTCVNGIKQWLESDFEETDHPTEKGGVSDA